MAALLRWRFIEFYIAKESGYSPNNSDRTEVMIYRQKIIAALESKRDAFASFDKGFQEERESYSDALNKLKSTPRTELESRLANAPTPGAIPTPEYDKGVDGVISFPQKFSNHQEARDWALTTLLDRKTFAADGSQIMPTKDFSVPVAIVQVGWFENNHSRDGQYVKDTKVEVLTPDDLFTETGADRQISEAEVNLRRFQLETARLCEYMKERSSDNGLNWPVAFFDNTLVISFAERFKDRRSSYIASMLPMLQCSEQTRVPLVGYVDTTFARDLTNMLQTCFELRTAKKVHDAILIDGFATNGMSWGDRTPVYVCARDGILEEYVDDSTDLRRRIGFLYIKTNVGLPARVDVPLWVYEAGLLDEVLDVVRAEVIVGNGYPYAIETADAVTAISQSDREIFLGVFQEFTSRQKIDLRYSRKALSKVRRR
ncbi:MAG TPA: DNA double-strand break repair nuclease NurA [Blastocatellia bacterium]|nr:DNA double-strand break repair nuclease NurA [Blastocatellia bacterium]